MSFGGHVLDMIRRQKANRELQKSGNSQYKLTSKYDDENKPKLKFNKEKFGNLSEEEIRLSRKNAKRSIRKERLMLNLKFFAVLILLLIGLYYFKVF